MKISVLTLKENNNTAFKLNTRLQDRVQLSIYTTLANRGYEVQMNM